jgi:DNA-binding LacI/PurR family transcriptional regulator/DNA-binding transcriptional regulator YhcF (GntR family)
MKTDRTKEESGRRLDHRLAERLREEICRRPPGDKLEGMPALAARYSTSINTMRMALAHLETEGLVEIRPGSGCYVRSHSPAVPARHVAILTEYNLLLNGSRADFYRHLMNELRLFLRAKGRPSRLYIGHQTSDTIPSETLTCTEFMEDLALHRIEGVIAMAVRPLYHWTQEAHERGIPIVGMRGCVDRFDISVDPDLEGGVRLALDLLRRRGRTRPGFLGWWPEIQKRFLTLASELSLDARPEWVRATIHPAQPGAGWAQVREIWAASSLKPDAVVFGDDVLFQDAVPAMVSLGVRIPEALEIVVLANSGIPLLAPFPFTRLDCNIRELASAMASSLIALMSGTSVANREISIPYRLMPPAAVLPEEAPTGRQTPSLEPAPGTLR